MFSFQYICKRKMSGSMIESNEIKYDRWTKEESCFNCVVSGYEYLKHWWMNTILSNWHGKRIFRLKTEPDFYSFDLIHWKWYYYTLNEPRHPNKKQREILVVYPCSLLRIRWVCVCACSGIWLFPSQLLYCCWCCCCFCSTNMSPEHFKVRQWEIIFVACFFIQTFFLWFFRISKFTLNMYTLLWRSSLI